MCAAYPELTSVFDSYPGKEEPGARIATGSIKSNSNKKRKTAWITPRRGGTWYVFAKILACGYLVQTIKSKLIHNENLYPVVIAVVKSCTESNKHIVSAKAIADKKDDIMFSVVLETCKYRIEVSIRKRLHHLQWHVYMFPFHETDNWIQCSGDVMRYFDFTRIRLWIDFLLERPYGYFAFLRPTKSFKKMLEEK